MREQLEYYKISVASAAETWALSHTCIAPLDLALEQLQHCGEKSMGSSGHDPLHVFAHSIADAVLLKQLKQIRFNAWRLKANTATVYHRVSALIVLCFLLSLFLACRPRIAVSGSSCLEEFAIPQLILFWRYMLQLSARLWRCSFT